VSHIIGFFVEGTVAILLVVTIVYCMILDRRLRRFRADEQSLKATILELVTATETAERAIGGLKMTVSESDGGLAAHLRDAERLSSEIARKLEAGDALLQRLSQIAAVGRASPVAAAAPPKPAVPKSSSNPQSILAAAQALVERAKLRAGDIAA
jgi:hypothetical protein